jgi:phenylalanine-4-hydroxylase
MYAVANEQLRVLKEKGLQFVPALILGQFVMSTKHMKRRYLGGLEPLGMHHETIVDLPLSIHDDEKYEWQIAFHYYKR